MDDRLHKGNTDVLFAGKCISELSERLKGFIDGLQDVCVLPARDEVSGL